MIHAASRQALVNVRESLSEMLSTPEAGDLGQPLAGDLYAAADLLSGQPRLRRTLGDASTDSSSRGGLARSLFAGKVGEQALELIVASVSQRWSSAWDLTDSLEILADDALLASAEQGGTLDQIEDELFRFERILEANPSLSSALDEAVVPADRRVALLRSVLADKVNPITVELVSHAVSSGRKRSVELALDDLLEASAVRRQRSVARVISATELTAEQNERLGRTLSALYGRPINVRTAIDPSIQGGLVIRVGDEVIDGTVAARLAAARTALAG